jgi:hypothetical protein
VDDLHSINAVDSEYQSPPIVDCQSPLLFTLAFQRMHMQGRQLLKVIKVVRDTNLADAEGVLQGNSLWPGLFGLSLRLKTPPEFAVREDQFHPNPYSPIHPMGEDNELYHVLQKLQTNKVVEGALLSHVAPNRLAAAFARPPWRAVIGGSTTSEVRKPISARHQHQ